MATTLQAILLAPAVRPSVLSDCQALVDHEVADMPGVSGAAVKVAYKVVTSFMPGYLTQTLEDMLPRMAEKLDPYWAHFSSSGGSEFGDYLAKHGDEVSESLLSITDEMAGESERPTIVKAYRSVRGGAAKHVQSALPRVGELVMKYAL